MGLGPYGLLRPPKTPRPPVHLDIPDLLDHASVGQYSLIHAQNKDANCNFQNKFHNGHNTQIDTRFGQIILGLRTASTLTNTFFWYCYMGIAMRHLKIQSHIFITVNSVVYTPHRVSLY